MRVNAFVSVVVAAGLVAVSSVVVAQNASPPSRETPRPQDIEPRVDTSATPPERETPRPEDLEPRVNTSAPEAAPGDTSDADEGAAASAATSPATPSTASGARASGAPRPADEQRSAKPAARNRAVDRLELDTTQITGNRELPKVLYIVPWKRSDLGDLVGKPINSLLDEVLTPVDRDVFQRENRYYRALTPGAIENDALSAPDSRPPTPTRNPVPTNSAPAAGSPGSATYPTSDAPTGSGSAASPRRDEK